MAPRDPVDCTPKVRVYDKTDKKEVSDDPNPNARTRTVVGKGHQLIGKIIENCGKDVESASWTIDTSRVVKDYIHTTDRGQVVPLTATDLKKSGKNAASTPLEFYWRASAKGNRMVGLEVKFSGIDDPASSAAFFAVQGPTLNNYTSKTSDVQVYKHQGKWTIRFQKYTPAPPAHGIRWTADVTGPEDFKGELFFTQLVTPNRHFYKDVDAKKKLAKLCVITPLATTPSSLERAQQAIRA